MNISSLIPWLSNFHTVQFSGSSGYFLFLNLLLSFFWLCKEAKYIYLCLHLGRNSFLSLISVQPYCLSGWKIVTGSFPCHRLLKLLSSQVRYYNRTCAFHVLSSIGKHRQLQCDHPGILEEKESLRAKEIPCLPIWEPFFYFKSSCPSRFNWWWYVIIAILLFIVLVFFFFLNNPL